MADTPTRIAIFGAGMIGCWVGGHLARIADVTLIGRQTTMEQLQTGMNLTDNQGLQLVVAPSSFQRTTKPHAMAEADLVIVSVKSGDTAMAARLIGRHAHENTTILSLQNGVANLETLKNALPNHRVVGGMVPYNVAQRVPGHFHRGTTGALVIEDSPAFHPFDSVFGAAGIPVGKCPDILALQWGKLLINLNNAVNSLSGMTLSGELSHHGYRRAWAMAMAEGLKILAASGIAPRDPLSIPLRLMPALLSLPNGLYQRIMAGRNGPQIDSFARSSMAIDLERGRPTEIDYIQGELVRRAEKMGWRAPVNQRLLELVKAAEDGASPVPPDKLLAELKAAQSAR